MQNENLLEYYLTKRADSLISFYVVVGIIFTVWLLEILFFSKDKIFKRYLIVYLILGTLLFLVRLDRVIQHYDILENVFYGTSLAPNLYRVVVPSLTFSLKSVISALSWLDSARIWNLIFILSVFPLFHIYLNKWFEGKVCFLITLLLGCLMPLSFLYDYPEDFLEIIVFITGYMFIRDKKYGFLCLLVFLATLNRETAIFLVFAYLISNIEIKNVLKISAKCFMLFTCWLIPFAGVRLIRGFKPYRCDFFMAGNNLADIKKSFLLTGSHVFDLLFFIFLFVFIYLIFNKDKEWNFFRRNIITILLIFIVGFSFASISEIRVFYPILPIVIPLAFYPLFGKIILDK